jgi:uncharacterized protein (TIGR02001 family)
VRLLRTGMVLLMGLAGGSQQLCAADTWGGSASITSDYLVRGISRSNDQPALQIDLHYLNTSGFLAGVFASNAQIDSDSPRDVELSGFVGFARNLGNDWRGRILATQYVYPWNKAGSQYNYDELDLDFGYREWLDIGVVYYPNAPYFTRNDYPQTGTAESAEIDFNRTVLGKLSGTAGIGYYYLNAPADAGYAYWSVGLAYDVAPWSLSVAYIEATGAANYLFYNAATGGRWTGTVIWRF